LKHKCPADKKAGHFLPKLFNKKLLAMKKRNPFITVMLFVLLLSTACHFNNYRTRTVRVNNDNTSLKIEYCGDIVFNQDETAIQEIEPEGYVKYRRDDKRFIAESDEDGNITYRLYNGKKRLKFDDDNAKDFIANAIKEIAEHCEQ